MGEKRAKERDRLRKENDGMNLSIDWNIKGKN